MQQNTLNNLCVKKRKTFLFVISLLTRSISIVYKMELFIYNRYKYRGFVYFKEVCPFKKYWSLSITLG